MIYLRICSFSEIILEGDFFKYQQGRNSWNLFTAQIWVFTKAQRRFMPFFVGADEGLELATVASCWICE